MFTGLIEYIGCVVQVRSIEAGKEFAIDLGPLSEDLHLGGSIAVDGTCLTATSLQGQRASFQVVPTTLAATTLGEFQAGRRVNLERPITLQGRLDGHLVQGHIDGTATLAQWIPQGCAQMARFEVCTELTDHMIARGSVAVNGVSLTIADLAEGAFSVALIPATLAATNLGELRPGQTVNIETDLIGKYVTRFLASGSQTSLTLEALREHGFV